MRHPLFASAALLACLTLPAIAADAPDAGAAAPPPPPTAVAEPEAVVPAPAPAELGVDTSIIRLRIESKSPSIGKPWKMEANDPRIGTGVVVAVAGKKYILTSAAPVSFATKIQLGAEKTDAVVLAQSPAMQLALLEIKDPARAEAFFKQHRPLDLVQWPAGVAIAGCTANEDKTSVIEGLVSESGVAPYGNTTGIRSIAKLSQFDPHAAFGPAISGGKLAGFYLGAQQTEDKKNVFAMLVPSIEIKTFLDDAVDGRYDGKWSLKKPLNLQPLVNDALRAKLGLKQETTGLLVNGEAADIAPFKPWDVLTAIGSHAVDNTGNTAIEHQFNGSALYYLDASANAKTATIQVTVLRDGKPVLLTVPAARRGAEWLPSLIQDGTPPRYFVYGPMCFQQATSELAQALVKQRGVELAFSGSPIADHLTDNALSTPGAEIVVLSHLFPKNSAAAGYPGAAFAAVQSVNGQAITSLRQLAKVLTESKDEFLVIRFHDKNSPVLVFKRDEMAKSTKDALDNNDIRHPCSPDLADILKY